MIRKLATLALLAAGAFTFVGCDELVCTDYANGVRVCQSFPAPLTP